MSNKLNGFPSRLFPLALLTLGFCFSTSFAQCKSPLTEATLRSLTLTTGFSPLQFQPGQTVNLRLYGTGGFPSSHVIDACASWSVSNDDLAVIDQTGTLTIKETTRRNRSFIVTASIENGRKIVSIPVYIYRPADNPFVGTWTEVERFSCKTGNRIKTFEPLVQVVFRADGGMFATRFAFETYFDFWGRYLFDLQSGDFGFVIDEGNQIPFDVDGFGQFTIDKEGTLSLKKLSIGRFNQEDKSACKYEFEKTSNDDPF